MSVREVRPPPAGEPATRRIPRADLVTAAGALGLIALAAVVGAVLYLSGRPVQASSAPFTAHWLPHVGPGTPVAITVAALTVWYGDRLTARLPWRPLLVTGYATAVAWILSLALVDGWHRGLSGRLTTSHEYLSEVPGVTDIPAMLRGFTGRILDFQPDSWTTHVAGHPPGAFLIFLGLDRLGLGGGSWAALLCVMVGALIAVAVPVTIRALGDEAAARAAWPFIVLFPGAIWIGASADGLFAGVTATGLALLAAARKPWAGFGAGLLLTFGLFLSYGLTLIAVPALAVILLIRRHRPLPWPALGAAVAAGATVVAVFKLAGFWWLDGYHLVVERYYQGVASHRAYSYWVWANLALVAGSAGPAAAVMLRRALLAHRWQPAVALLRRAVLARRWQQAAVLPRRAVLAHRWQPAAVLPRRAVLAHRWQPAAVLPRRAVLAHRWQPAAVLPCAALLAIAAADLSGLSKAEVERIWLPFTVWLMAGAALLPAGSRRFWLAVQATTALLINHLLLTSW